MADHLYGVFLRPDTTTAHAVTEITFHVQRQFGLVSAGAFPPHATLAGSVPSNHDTEAVVAALDPVLKGHPSFTVHNAGIARRRSTVTYDVNANPDGTVNQTLTTLAIDINRALEPLAETTEGYLVKTFVPENFHAHLSLASHELQVDPRLIPEVEEFIRELPYTPSATFPARYITLYRFHSDDWAGHWWNTLTWDRLHTWTLEP